MSDTPSTRPEHEELDSVPEAGASTTAEADLDDEALDAAWSGEAGPVEDGLLGETEEGPVEEGQLAYDCAAWAGETRSVLRSLLVSRGIPHAWQGTTLTVRDEDEELVDVLIDEVSGSARPALDPDVVRVVYEVAAWPVGLQTRLAEGLATSDVAYEWDEQGDLVVAEADEDEVEAILAELPDPDDSLISSDDGMAVHELLDSIFMASDRLARNGADASGTVAIVDAAAVVEQLALPFGFEPGQWRTFVATVVELRSAIDGEVGGEDEAGPVDDERISVLAGRVRDLVRLYV